MNLKLANMKKKFKIGDKVWMLTRKEWAIISKQWYRGEKKGFCVVNPVNKPYWAIITHEDFLTNDLTQNPNGVKNES